MCSARCPLPRRPRRLRRLRRPRRPRRLRRPRLPRRPRVPRVPRVPRRPRVPSPTRAAGTARCRFSGIRESAVTSDALRRSKPGLRLGGDTERQKPRPGLEGGRAGVRILIADDDPAIRDSLERVLQVEGYETSTVSNGLAVLDEFGGAGGAGGAGGDTLDLLLLDVMMPRLGGLETC